MLKNLKDGELQRVEFKNYYFNLESLTDEEIFEELKLFLNDLNLYYEYSFRLILNWRTKRAFLYHDCPYDIQKKLLLTPIYESPSILDDSIKKFTAKCVTLQVDVSLLDDDLFEEFDSVIRMFIKNNFNEY